MMVYTGGVGGQALEQLRRFERGMLVSPRAWRRPIEGIPWALDNAAYRSYLRGEPWAEEPFVKLFFDEDYYGEGKLYVESYGVGLPRFAVVPDIVCGGNESLEFSRDWFDRLPHDLRWYLAVQPGMREEDVAEAWEEAEELSGLCLAGIFVGGTLDYKWRTIEQWRRFTHERDAALHVGGLSSLKALVRVELAGADSVDSTAFARFGTFHVVEEARRIARRQTRLPRVA